MGKAAVSYLEIILSHFDYLLVEKMQNKLARYYKYCRNYFNFYESLQLQNCKFLVELIRWWSKPEVVRLLFAFL